jgi:hypothetical protein
MNKSELKHLIREEIQKVITEEEDSNEVKDQEMLSGDEDELYKNVYKKLLDFRAPNKYHGGMKNTRWKDLSQELLNKAFGGMNIRQKIKNLKNTAPEYSKRKRMNLGFDRLIDTYIAIEINKELWGQK